METNFYISTNKTDGSVKVSAEEISRFLQFVEKKNCRRGELCKGPCFSLNAYIDEFLFKIESGALITNKGFRYSTGSIQCMKQALNKFKEYQQIRGLQLGVEDIGMNIYKDYIAFLMEENYSLNSIGKCIKKLKQVILSAEDEGHPINQAVKGSAFKVYSTTSDAIHLTLEELQSIQSVDLSTLPQCYTQARDIFMIGVWTAQRVSDYNNLTWDNITTEHIFLHDNTLRPLRTIRLTQQKTGKRVIIPCNTPLNRILQRYESSNSPLPHLYDQKINNLMKKIGQMAGINTTVEITVTKGGTVSLKRLPKWQLIQTHTARRTGATLMYLSGMDVYDICRITGHSSIQNLERYIKASELETLKKISSRYEFFR